MVLFRRLIGLLCVKSVAALRKELDSTRFDNFFPQFRGIFTAIRDGPCAQLYARKNSGQPVCVELLDCMLEHTKESVKGDLASGVLALGLTPTILTLLGSSTAETGLLSRRRPILALLIALGAPSVSPIKTFEYIDPISSLEEHQRLPTHFMSKRAPLITGLQYLVVLGAVANVYTVCFYTGSWTIDTTSCDTSWRPLLWAGISFLVHSLAMLSLSMSVSTLRDESWKRRSFLDAFLEWLTNEFTPCITQKKLTLARKPESTQFIIITWFLSIFTVAHTLYGTLAFSNLQFIGTIDCIKIIGRLVASAVVCRIVLMFELAGMRNATDKPTTRTQQSQETIPLENVAESSRSLSLRSGGS